MIQTWLALSQLVTFRLKSQDRQRQWPEHTWLAGFLLGLVRLTPKDIERNLLV